MPAAADAQTQNAGSKVGRAESGDSITYTFAGTITPSLVLAGWNGSATLVTVHFQQNAKDDVVTIRNASTGATLFALGVLDLHGDYSNNADFTSSVMSASGNRITVVLGVLSGHMKEKAGPATMVWTAPTNTVSESGPSDKEF
jgi:hypothetical protein